MKSVGQNHPSTCEGNLRELKDVRTRSIKPNSDENSKEIRYASNKNSKRYSLRLCAFARCLSSRKKSPFENERASSEEFLKNLDLDRELQHIAT